VPPFTHSASVEMFKIRERLSFNQQISSRTCFFPPPESYKLSLPMQFNKISKTILNPVRDINSGIRVAQMAAVNHNAASPAVISGRVANRLTTSLHPGSMGTSVQRVVDERKNPTPEHSKSIPARRASDTSNIKDLSTAVKLEPGESHLKGNSPVKAAEVVCLNQQSTPSSKSSSVPVAAAAQVRPSAISVSKDNAELKTFPVTRTLNKPSPKRISVLSNHTNSKISTWAREVRSHDVARIREPESFPVISSVFSLSEQPEGGQGSIQPLVMALRGIVMDKKGSSGSMTQGNMKIINGTEQITPTSGHCAQVATKKESFTRDVLLTEQTSQSLKVEDQDKGIQHPPAPTQNGTLLKEENNDTKTSDTNTCSHSPKSKSLPCEESEIASSVEESTTADPEHQTDKTEQDISSKFLTICLKRVQVGVWRKRKKGLKLRISRCKPQVPVGSLTDYPVVYPMPLREDQPVKRPGPNQPVVVLNHPKPRASAQGMTADTFADMGASEPVPKCQILKMRLSKVMGQKYEVMGCTVGVFP